MRRLASVLLWSVVAAAFIGPGTVTTAATAGSGHGLTLLWALAFSTVATLVLQEAAARVTVVSGDDLGRALAADARGGARGVLVLVVVLGAVLLGCAAYEAGNLLGGVAGAALGLPSWPPALLTALCGLMAAGLLALGSPRQVARALSVLVAVMGAAFLATAWQLGPSPGDLASGLAVPRVPAGSGLLVLGLVGTTVVPYNLFLGSGLAAGETLRETRFGLTVAVVLGGVISMAVLVVGTAVAGEMTFVSLATVLSDRLGPWARGLFAVGLLAAGLSSAITAPLAAAITARSVFSRNAEDPRWGERSARFRGVWGGVLGVGLVFALTGVRPEPAIILAQALNGVLLPLAAVYLALVVNDRRRLGAEGINGGVANLLLAPVVAVTVLLGVSQLLRALAAALGWSVPAETVIFAVAGGVTLLLAVPVARAILARRR